MVISPAKARAFHDAAPAADKAYAEYEGALHGLVCEPDPVRSRFVGDVVRWLDELRKRDEQSWPPASEKSELR